MIKFIKLFVGYMSAISYGYLKWNIEGYWFALPLIVLVICLSINIGENAKK